MFSDFWAFSASLIFILLLRFSTLLPFPSHRHFFCLPTSFFFFSKYHFHYFFLYFLSFFLLRGLILPFLLLLFWYFFVILFFFCPSIHRQIPLFCLPFLFLSFLFSVFSISSCCSFSFLFYHFISFYAFFVLLHPVYSLLFHLILLGFFLSHSTA